MTQTATQSALFIAARLGRTWGEIGANDMARLLFLAQSWHLLSNGEPLFRDVIYAGYQGPVIKGLTRLPDLPRFPAELIDLPGRAFLDGFCHTYGAADAQSVRQQVCREDGAWALTRKVSGDLTPIHHDLMAATFRLMLLDHAETSRRKRIEMTEAIVGQAKGDNIVAFRLA
jgi:hypothetical protein